MNYLACSSIMHCDMIKSEFEQMNSSNICLSCSLMISSLSNQESSDFSKRRSNQSCNTSSSYRNRDRKTAFLKRLIVKSGKILEEMGHVALPVDCTQFNCYTWASRNATTVSLLHLRRAVQSHCPKSGFLRKQIRDVQNSNSIRLLKQKFQSFKKQKKINTVSSAI